MRSTRTNLIHSLKTHCFDCVKQSCRLWVIFYLREFCSLDTDSIEFFMSRSNRCHKSVWIYYYYYLHIINCIFSLLKTKFIIINWLWILQVIVSDFSSSLNLAFVMTFSKVLIIICWVKHLHFSQCKWCKLKSFTTSYLQSFLSSSFKREIVESFSVNVMNNELKL